jgi:hypothetical protein
VSAHHPGAKTTRGGLTARVVRAHPAAQHGEPMTTLDTSRRLVVAGYLSQTVTLSDSRFGSAALIDRSGADSGPPDR